MTTRTNGRSAASHWVVLLLLCSSLLPAGCQTQDPALQPERAARNNDPLEDFEAGADRAPTARTLYATARLLAAQRRDSQCESLLTRIIREHPAFMPAYCELAELRVRQRRVDEAVATLRAAQRQSPGDPVVINNLGMCAMLKGEYQEALDLFTQAVAKVPDNARYRANMAAACGMLGRYEEALALYRQTVSEADAQHNLGVLHRARAGQLAHGRTGGDRLLQRSLADLPQTQPAQP